MNYYKSKLEGATEIKGINLLKNKAYTDKYGVEVIYLYIDKGFIVNINDLKQYLREYR